MAASYGYETLHTEADGPVDGEPVLLLHGWGSSGQAMRPVARALNDAYRTYTVDLPGHGHSPPPPEPWGVPEQANLVNALIRERIGDSVTVVGHSNGGRIALYMASTPALAETIDRLVLISPSGITPERSLGTRIRSKIARTLKAPFEALPSPLREPALDWLKHTLLWRALGSADYNALDGVMRETFVKTVNHHLDGPVHRIDVPTLIFWGDEDEAISRRQMKRLKEAVPNAGFVVLEGAGHYGHLDDLSTVASTTRRFLRATERDASPHAEGN